jgi:hypothetical membrane protein
MPGMRGLHPVCGLYRMRAVYRLRRLHWLRELLGSAECRGRQKRSRAARRVSGRLGGAALWTVGVVGYLVLEAVTAAGYEPSYSYWHNYISDLGKTGARVHLMHAAFCLQGTMFLLGTLAMVGVPRSGRARLFVGLVAANCVGNVVVGTVHSGKLHVAGAALALAGGNAAILAGSTWVGPVPAWYRSVSKLIAAVGFFCLLMLVNVRSLPIGVVERGSAYAIFAWQLLTVACLLSARRTCVQGAYSAENKP